MPEQSSFSDIESTLTSENIMVFLRDFLNGFPEITVKSSGLKLDSATIDSFYVEHNCKGHPQEDEYEDEYEEYEIYELLVLNVRLHKDSVQVFTANELFPSRFNYISRRFQESTGLRLGCTAEAFP